MKDFLTSFSCCCFFCFFVSSITTVCDKLFIEYLWRAVTHSNDILPYFHVKRIHFIYEKIVKTFYRATLWHKALCKVTIIHFVGWNSKPICEQRSEYHINLTSTLAMFDAAVRISQNFKSVKHIQEFSVKRAIWLLMTINYTPYYYSNHLDAMEQNRNQIVLFMVMNNVDRLVLTKKNKILNYQSSFWILENSRR